MTHWRLSFYRTTCGLLVVALTITVVSAQQELAPPETAQHVESLPVQADSPTLAPVVDEQGYQDAASVAETADATYVTQPVCNGDTCVASASYCTSTAHSCGGCGGCGGCNGCCHCRGCYEIREPGSLVYQAMSTQVANGACSRTTLYRFDFIDAEGNESDQLSPRGYSELAKIVRRWQAYGVPIRIESSGIEHMDQRRQVAVATAVAEQGFEVTPESILVINRAPGGLWGVEAQLIYGRMLQQTATGAVLQRNQNQGGNSGFFGFGNFGRGGNLNNTRNTGNTRGF